MECTELTIICPDEPDMENTFEKDEIEKDMREMMQTPQGTDWIEWVMFHDDVDDYFNDKIVEIVSMPEFKEGTFVLNGVEFTFKKA